VTRRQEQFESFKAQLIGEYSVKGLAMSVIDAKGNALYESYDGYRDEENKLPVNEDTIFGIASLTKSFTCCALQQLAQRGLISADDEASNHLEYFRGERSRGVTVADLMSHSAGFLPRERLTVERAERQLGIWQDGKYDPARDPRLAEYAGRKTAEGLLRSPRMPVNEKLFSYCNDGYGLLSEIVRQKGGCSSYAEYIEEAILKPLDMTRSFCDFERTGREENITVLYSYKEGHLTPHKNYYENAFALMGGGALKSTLRDMKRYLAMLMNKGRLADGTCLIEPGRAEEMTRERVPFRSRQHYGFGLMIARLEERKTVWHLGTLPGVSSHLSWAPEAGIGVIILCNTSETPVHLLGKTALSWQMGLPQEKPQTADHAPSHALTKAIAGTYEIVEGARKTLTIALQGDELTLTLNGQHLPHRFISPDRLLLSSKLDQLELKILRNESGAVWAVFFGDRIMPKIL